MQAQSSAQGAGCCQTIPQSAARSSNTPVPSVCRVASPKSKLGTGGAGYLPTRIPSSIVIRIFEVLVLRLWYLAFSVSYATPLLFRARQLLGHQITRSQPALLKVRARAAPGTYRPGSIPTQHSNYGPMTQHRFFSHSSKTSGIPCTPNGAGVVAFITSHLCKYFPAGFVDIHPLRSSASALITGTHCQQPQRKL
ncbi:hypothetical protein IF1G_01960 [Cordyceps javanica]|uniref:Uncharacterized protein n=1 Tax=Cordyceps javanica TaxID=43265 RepID=A0A545VDG0_9HYPO|nr:hypothetical protein IF1G_01960 [Cordyceps javanica]